MCRSKKVINSVCVSMIYLSFVLIPLTNHRCCNTCEDVREAYRRKGWAFNLPDGIVQCEREGWTEKIRSQKDEGCRVKGYVEVSKVIMLGHTITLMSLFH